MKELIAIDPKTAAESSLERCTWLSGMSSIFVAWYFNYANTTRIFVPKHAQAHTHPSTQTLQIHAVEFYIKWANAQPNGDNCSLNLSENLKVLNLISLKL